MNSARSFLAPLVLASLFAGCNVSIPKRSAPAASSGTATTKSPPAPPATEPAPSPTPPSSATAAAPVETEAPIFRVPVGPTLLILPGEGLGPIRFGATLATIERLMEDKCTEVTEQKGITWCRYQANAVDFGLRKGELVEIHVHGVEREFTPGKGLGVENSYGIFRGAFSNQAQLGMFPKWVDQGKPKRVQKVQPGRFPTVEKHYYPDMILEYDKLQNGNVVLGGVVLTKPKGGKTKSQPKAAGSKPKRKPLH